jgi:hypothetical protein
MDELDNKWKDVLSNEYSSEVKCMLLEPEEKEVDLCQNLK